MEGPTLFLKGSGIRSDFQGPQSDLQEDKGSAN